MREWLSRTQTHHKFEWDNTGAYLPARVWLDNDSAVIFKLKYGL